MNHHGPAHLGGDRKLRFKHRSLMLSIRELVEVIQPHFPHPNDGWIAAQIPQYGQFIEHRLLRVIRMHSNDAADILPHLPILLPADGNGCTTVGD